MLDIKHMTLYNETIKDKRKDKMESIEKIEQDTNKIKEIKNDIINIMNNLEV